MPQRRDLISFNEYYHCYNRGTESRKIFLVNDDYLRFISLLYLCNSESLIRASDFKNKKIEELFALKRGNPLVAIGAWCLMPNHFHLLVKEVKEGGITKFMSKLSIAFSMYFNIKHSRKGTLFESRFKAKHVDSDKYLKYLFSYIHLNPVKLIDSKWKDDGLRDFVKTEEYLNKYEFFSFPEYAGIKRVYEKILNRSEFPEYFNLKDDFLKEIYNWLSFGEISGLDEIDKT